MANIKSNIKSHKQDVKQNMINKSALSAMKTSIKKALATKTAVDVSNAYRLIDSTASKGIIHTNKANRLKSKLMRKVK